MKIRMISILLLSLFLTGLNSGCKDKEGCTDINADNYNRDAEKNSGCVYRYSSSIEVSNVPNMNAAGTNWDADGTGPDLKVNFGKSMGNEFEFTTNTSMNSSSASLVPASSIQFTNETWKYELVDEDLLSGNEIIASGTFNPVDEGESNIIRITTGNIIIQFKYNIK